MLLVTDGLDFGLMVAHVPRKRFTEARIGR
jgi:hypothetical protein